MSTYFPQINWALFRSLFFCTIIIFYYSDLKAQASTDNNIYVQFTYIRTFPGKHNAYLDLIRNYTSKVMEYNVRQGKLFGGYVNEVIMPQGSESDYDVVNVTVSNSFKTLMDDSLQAKMVLKSSFPAYSDWQVDSILGLYGSMRNIVKRDIFSGISEMNQKSSTTKYCTVTYMQSMPGRNDDYEKMEKETFLPVHKERMKMGLINDWVFMKNLFPYDSKSPYNYVTVEFYDDLNSYLNAKYTEAFKKAFPQMNMVQVGQRITANRRIEKNEVWKLVTYVDNSNLKK